MNNSFFKIECTDNTSTWLNLEALVELYIDKANKQVLAYRTKDEFTRYAVTEETCNKLEIVLASQVTPATLKDELMTGLKELFAVLETPTPTPPANDDDLPFTDEEYRQWKDSAASVLNDSDTALPPKKTPKSRIKKTDA